MRGTETRNDDMESEGIRCRTEMRKLYFKDRKTENYGSAAKFAETMRNWVNEYHRWETACQHLQAEHQAQYLQQMQNQQQGQPQQHPLNIRRRLGFLSRNENRIEISNAPVQVFEPASVFRRVLAELIDFIVCLAIKLVIVLTLIELEVIDIDDYQKALEDESDFIEFITMTQSLLPLEIVCKMICAFLEAGVMCINLGIWPRGYTPGKYLVGIRVISAEMVTETGVPNQIRVHGAKEITGSQSLCRAFLKNMVVNSLFPLSTAAFNFSATRSFYDSLLKTVVVVS